MTCVSCSPSEARRNIYIYIYMYKYIYIYIHIHIYIIYNMYVYYCAIRVELQCCILPCLHRWVRLRDLRQSCLTCCTVLLLVVIIIVVIMIIVVILVNRVVENSGGFLLRGVARRRQCRDVSRCRRAPACQPPSAASSIQK